MINKSSLEAIKAMIELAKLNKEEFEGAGRIAKRIDAPANYLGKLLQGLCGEGLVVSQKGFGGGFRLARDANKITLFDIVEPIEAASRWEGCILGRRQCSSATPCAMHERWEKVRRVYLEFLKNTTIEDLKK